MSETVETEDETSQESQTETTETTRATEDSGSGLDDYVSPEEQEILKDWAVYVAGLFAVIGLAFGLNSRLQAQWEHNLVFQTSPSGSRVGQLIDVLFMSNPHLWLTMSLPIAVLSGVLIARNVSNEDLTAYKVAGVTAIVGLVAVGIISGLLGVALADDFNVNLANVLVSSLASGIAAAVSSMIAVYLTVEQAPEPISP